MSRFRSSFLFCLVLCFCSQRGITATLLFDFEEDAEISLWHDEGKDTLGKDKRLAASTVLAASGKQAMRFFTPAWRPEEHGGRQKWPAFEGTPPIGDWERFDRLVFEIVNTTAVPQKLMLFITDSKKATRSGLPHRELLAPHGYTQAVVELRKGFAARKIASGDIQRMHFYTEDPPEDMTIVLDRFLLLEPGESVPAPQRQFVDDFVALQKPAVDGARAGIGEACEEMLGQATGSAQVAEWVRTEREALLSQVSSLALAASSDASLGLMLPGKLSRLRDQVAWMQSVLATRLAFERIRPQVAQDAESGRGIVVGTVDSMTKVLPRAALPELEISPAVELAAARNETESFQVVVLPMEASAQDVSLRVGELLSADGDRLAADVVTSSVVGYVETKERPPYGASHVGWWPDPILDFMSSTEIAKGDAQAYWVRVKPPKAQPAGRYSGTLEVLQSGRVAFRFRLLVNVYGFSLPDTSPLPMAITFAPHDHPTNETRALQAEWRKSANYPVVGWRKHKALWGEFLADYFITYDSLYAYKNRGPDFDILARLHTQGRLGRFNLGYYGKCPAAPDGIAAWQKTVIDRIRPRYERARELGLLDHAYIYGCDEHRKEDFPQVERAAARIKAAFPDVMVMTTTYDHSFGADSVITSMDAWCPLTPRYDMEKATVARKHGKEVWWYICCGPRHPHANMFIEYPAIEGRLLMGAMTAKYRPDGFLYYQISIWNSQHPIDSGPFTHWDPRSWTTYHGDGSWTCVGPKGTPLPTIRLENFRDGLEDYAYYRILEATSAAVTAKEERGVPRGDWSARARALMEVPQDVVKSMKDYTRDPGVLYRYRNALGNCINEAPIAPVSPWDQ